jgi:hypothetical protein
MPRARGGIQIVVKYRSSSSSAARHGRDRDGTTTESRAVPSRDPVLCHGRGGSDPSGPARAARRGGKAARNQGGRSPLARDPGLDPARGDERRVAEPSARRKVTAYQALCGDVSAFIVLFDPRRSGLAEGLARGPAVLRAAGPISTRSPAIRIACRSAAIKSHDVQ